MRTGFAYAPEAGQNAHAGITSFQHFRRDDLYSDIVVKPENNMTETERVEGYPVPAGVAQHGRAEGYYPDTAVAYIRVLWKEYEPQPEMYNDAFMEEILRKAGENGQTVMFRLMPHSTRESDDLPDWVKKEMPCPARPAGARVKDSPTDPRFLRRFIRVIRHLGRYDADPRLEAVDISLPGAWGEGYRTENYPAEDLQALMDAYAASFPHTLLLGQLRRPELLEYTGRRHPVGWRGDGVGNPYLMEEYYPKQLSQCPADLWKTAPVAFESYWWLGEWKRQGWDPKPLFGQMLRWHASYFNPKSLPIPPEWREAVDDFAGKLGYHFYPHWVNVPEEGKAGEALHLSVELENRGVAPVYCPLEVTVRLVRDTAAVTLPAPLDARKWLPGVWEETFAVALPADLPAGDYEVELGLGTDKAPAWFCCDAPRRGRFIRVGALHIKG